MTAALHHRIVRLLIHARRDAGLTQAQLAARLRQKVGFVFHYEASGRRLDIAELILIFRVLDVEPFQLLQQAKREE